MATTTEVLVKNPVLNVIPKSIYDTITPEANEIYAVDMEYVGNKVVVTDASGDVVESATNSAKLTYLDNVSSDIQTQLNAKVGDVTINETSVVNNSGVAVIPFASASVYGVTKLSANLTSISDTIAASASMGNNLAQNIITGVGTYSNTSTYAVGDKTRKGQYYYECITPITSGHDWDANEWKQITIQEQIDASVGDVTIDGTSIVSNRVAVIPLAEASGDYGLVKLSSDSSGITLDSSSKRMQLRRATDADIKATTRTQAYRPIVPKNLDLAVQYALSSPSIDTTTGNPEVTWTSEQQAGARNTIGATQVVIREWD